jgi:CubicO group peptidase (beta-lactamase class C family)
MTLAGGAGVLSEATVRAMTAPQVTAGQIGTNDAFLQGRSWAFGQAVATGGPHAGAYGWDGGLGSSYRVDPSCDLAVIVLTQRMWSTAVPPAVHGDLEAAAYAALA